MHTPMPRLRPVERLVNDTHPTTAETSTSVTSADLFKGQTSIRIEHNGASYRLQTTKLGKLILTK